MRTIVVFLWLLGNIVYGQERPFFTVFFENGDILSGYTTISDVHFNTQYGSLTIPIQEVQQISLGLYQKDLDKSLLLELLSRIEFGTREAKTQAFDAVLTMGPEVLPFVEAYIETMPETEEDTVYSDITMSLLYEVLVDKHSISRQYTVSDQLNYGNCCHIEGTYEADSFWLETQYGEMTVFRTEISRIEVEIKNEESNSLQYITLPGTHVASSKEGTGWMNTGFLVKKGQVLTIQADGEIVLDETDGTQSSPNGISDELWEGTYSQGQLIGKIGKQGEIIQIGENYKKTVHQTGILFLSIYDDSEKGNNHKGYYNITITTK